MLVFSGVVAVEEHPVATGNRSVDLPSSLTVGQSEVSESGSPRDRKKRRSRRYSVCRYTCGSLGHVQQFTTAIATKGEPRLKKKVTSVQTSTT